MKLDIYTKNNNFNYFVVIQKYNSWKLDTFTYILLYFIIYTLHSEIFKTFK